MKSKEKQIENVIDKLRELDQAFLMLMVKMCFLGIILILILFFLGMKPSIGLFISSLVFFFICFFSFFFVFGKKIFRKYKRKQKDLFEKNKPLFDEYKVYAQEKVKSEQPKTIIDMLGVSDIDFVLLMKIAEIEKKFS